MSVLAIGRPAAWKRLGDKALRRRWRCEQREPVGATENGSGHGLAFLSSEIGRGRT